MRRLYMAILPLLVGLPITAFGQDMLDNFEMQYSIQCASPNDQMTQQACAMMRQQLDQARQQRLEQMQTDNGRAAQAADDAAVSAQAAQLQASVEQMKAQIQAQQAAQIAARAQANAVATTASSRPSGSSPATNTDNFTCPIGYGTCHELGVNHHR